MEPDWPPTLADGDFHGTLLAGAEGADDVRPSVQLVRGILYTVTGAALELRFSTTDPQGPQDLDAFLVGLEGYDGHYEVAIADPTGTTALSLLNDPDAELADGDVLVLNVAARDLAGHVSTPETHTLTVVEVMTGDVQVALSWDLSEDLEIYVVEPSGEEIYFGHSSSATGGLLDLDSNPGCGIDGINHESISWAPGQAPRGEYEVRVNYWSNCGTTETVNYTVTVRHSGVVETFTGSFEPGEAVGGGSGAGVVVATFEHAL